MDQLKKDLYQETELLMIARKEHRDEEHRKVRMLELYNQIQKKENKCLS